jgi:hypothetical protein
MKAWFLVALTACHSSSKAPPTRITKLGLAIDAPAGVKVDDTGPSVFVTNGTFKLNLFVVDEYSQPSADAQRATIERDPAFVKFTTEQPGDKTWRFDYELARGKAGTISRIDVGHPLDCGIHGVTPDVAAAVARACASLKKL